MRSTSKKRGSVAPEVFASRGHVYTLVCLAAQAIAAYDKLLKAVTANDVQYAALMCRNLLELGVWVPYSIRSAANAQRLKQDADREVNGFLAAFEKLMDIAETSPTLSTRIPSIVEYRRQLREATGPPDGTDTHFKRVSSAARELSAEDGAAYSALNAVLSKFIHPTALMIHSVITPEDAPKFTGFMLKLGQVSVLRILEETAKAVSSLAAAPDTNSLREGMP